MLWLSYLLDYLYTQYASSQPGAVRKNSVKSFESNPHKSPPGTIKSTVLASVESVKSAPSPSTQPIQNPAQRLDFNNEIKDLKRLFNTRTLVKNGAFRNAGDVLMYCVNRGFVGEWQLEGERDGDLSYVLEGRGMAESQ